MSALLVCKDYEETAALVACLYIARPKLGPASFPNRRLQQVSFVDCA